MLFRVLFLCIANTGHSFWAPNNSLNSWEEKKFQWYSFSSNWIFFSELLRFFCAYSRCREYWMIYRGPGFLAFVWFGSSPTPSPVSKLFLFRGIPVCRRSSLMTGEGGRGAKSYDRGKTWPSITLSTLSVPVLRFRIRTGPHSFWSPGSGSRRAKINHKSEETSSFEVLDILFWGMKTFFSCSLKVLYGGLGTSKLQFFYQKN